MIIAWVLIVSLYGNHSYAKPVVNHDACVAEAKKAVSEGDFALCVKVLVPKGER